MAGKLIASTFFREGMYVQAYSTYGGARRGAPVATFIRVDDEPIRLRCDIEEPDAIACFDPSLLNEKLVAGIRKDTIVLVNSEGDPADFADLGDFKLATVDAIAIASQNGLGRIVNSTVTGAFAGLMGVPDIEVLSEVIREVSPVKMEENVQSARDGYRLVKNGWE